MNQYKPIACADYDTFEIAIMRGQNLNVDWRDTDGSARRITLKPTDLKIQEGAEYLIAETAQGEKMELRLDWIETAEPVS